MSVLNVTKLQYANHIKENWEGWGTSKPMARPPRHCKKPAIIYNV